MLSEGLTAFLLSWRQQCVLVKLDRDNLTGGRYAHLPSWNLQSVLAMLEAAGSLLAEPQIGHARWLRKRLGVSGWLRLLRPQQQAR